MAYELSISFKVLVKESPIEVFNTLTNSEKLTKLNGSVASIQNKEETSFSQLDGYIIGKNKKLEIGKLIVQLWRAKSWDINHYSNVTFKLHKVERGTLIDFKHENCPNNWIDCWNERYFNNFTRLDSGTFILFYYDIQGRGEQLRYALAACGFNFNDKRKGIDVIKNNPLKSTYGQLPILRHNDVWYSQGTAILQYICKLGKLWPTNLKYEAIAIQIVLSVEDCRTLLTDACQAKKNKDMETYEQWDNVHKIRYLNGFKLQLGKDDYFVNDKFSGADISVYNLLNDFVLELDKNSLDQYPTLLKFIKRVEKNEGIKQYLSL